MGWFKRAACVLGATVALSGCMRDENFEEKQYLFGDKNFGVRPLIAVSPNADSIREPTAEEIYNTSEDFRSVPKHPDDGWTGRSSAPPIPDDSAFLPKAKHRRSFFKFGVEAMFFDRIGLDVYGGIDEIEEEEGFPHSFDDSRGEVNEVNYSNRVGTDQRGYGAALTYWAANFKGGRIPRFNADVILKLTKGSNINHSLLAGIGIVKYEVEGMTGYDRWDRLQSFGTTRLGEVVEKEIYGGYRINDEFERIHFNLKAGKRSYDFDGKDGAKMRFDSDSESFISVGAEFRL